MPEQPQPPQVGFYDRYIATPRGVVTLAAGTLIVGAYTVYELVLQNHANALTAVSTLVTALGIGLTWSAAHSELWKNKTERTGPPPPTTPQ